MEPVNPKLVSIALADVDTATFERFGQSFYSAIAGKAFVPLGGMHDGGAEGYLEPEVFGDPASHFLQVSKQESYSQKVRQTVRRLREFGRAPVSLTYLTSLTIEHIDRVEEQLSDELNCRIRIRDGKYIENQVNYSDATIQAFEAFLRPALFHLLQPGSAPLANRANLHADRTLAVFLRQEVENRRGKADLLESVSDSLILWALRDTDPDKAKFLTRAEILKTIEQALPSARDFIRGVLDHRLERLHDKDGTDGRQIRYHRKADGYCLPYETRQIVARENIEDESLKLEVTDILRKRASAILADDASDQLAADSARLCHMVLERAFERQGLQIAQFAVGGEEDDDLYTNVADIVTDILDREEFHSERKSELRPLTISVLRQTFYGSTEQERVYLEKLSRTYVLMLLLKNDPKVVEYFKTIASSFVLYIGTDFVVRALSEHYLNSESQTTVNLFNVLKEAGARLILTQKTVEEVATHIRAQIFEFEHMYSYLEHKISLGFVEFIDRILIRSYFYAKLAPFPGKKSPAGWKSYIDQFAPYNDIKNDRGDDELARYLTNRFGFEYESTDVTMSGLNAEDIEDLKNKILEIRREYGALKDSAEVLAYNDALQVLRIYEARKQGSERSPSNPFGWKTWWLTQDAKVRRASGAVVFKEGARFMMRPEFLLSFVYSAPSLRQVQESYRTVFPSILGVQLSNRLNSAAFKRVVQHANEVWAVDEARASSMITGLLDALKGDNLKVYEQKIWAEG